jgi:hypothetical protein
MSCPYTSPQNGKAERMLCTTNNIVRTLMFQASMPPQYWVECLHTATYLLNHLPMKSITTSCPYTAPYNTLPTYKHLRVFWCVYYPSLSATAPHKLAPHSTWCVFISYSLDNKGYHYLDLSTNCVMISRHVIFMRPASLCSFTPSHYDYEFLSEMDLVVSPNGTRLSAGTPMTTAGGSTATKGNLTPSPPWLHGSIRRSNRLRCRGWRSDRASR